MSDLSDCIANLKGQGDLITFGQLSFMSIKVSVKNTTSVFIESEVTVVHSLFAENDIHQMTTMTMRSQGCHGWR